MDVLFEVEMQVRDYECDLQGIVNNAVYQNYLEHARHEFLHDIGLDFDQLCRDGIDAVATRVEINYQAPLKPRDLFVVQVGVRKNGRLRFVFQQEIVRKSDGQKIVEAQVTAVLTRNGKPLPPILVEEALAANGVVFA